MGWIGVDLDGTLAEYGGWKGPDSIGKPIPAMLDRVLDWCNAGQEVRIFTARATVPEQIAPVEAWCQKHLGRVLKVTNVKDFGMIELWDDRLGVAVEFNTGKVLRQRPTEPKRHQEPCALPQHATDSCIYLADGTKVVLARDPHDKKDVRLEVKPQDVITLC